MKTPLHLKLLRGGKRAYHLSKSFLASLYFKNNTKDLVIIGVTGTSGKSTTSSLIYQVLKKNGLNAGLLSTVGAVAGNKLLDTGLHVTTPDPIQLQKLLKEMNKEGINYLVVEASSHALSQGRLGVLKFDYAVFTNIKKDHLDYHKNWEEYALAKGKLIDKLKKDGKAILNADDKDAYKFLIDHKIKGKNKDLISYSVSSEVQNIKTDINGIDFTFDEQPFHLPIIGEYNIDNALAAIKLGLDLKIPLPDIAKALETFKGVEGRMELMQRNPFNVIIDFAHNANSLEQSLLSAKILVKKEGKLISVFGSAGLRDIEKRGEMGKISGRYADITIVTAEDPRTESLEKINSQIIEGVEAEGAKLVKRFKTRKEYQSYEITSLDGKSIFAFDEEDVRSRFDAIEFALKIADEGDVVITEGKGHEQSLCFGKTEYPFTDKDAVLKGLKTIRAIQKQIG